MTALLDRIAAANRDISRAVDPVSTAEFARMLVEGNQGGATSSGVSVGVKRALGITAWYSGCRYLSEAVSGLPWQHFLRLPNDERTRRAPQVWLEGPDVEQTWLGFIEHQMMSLLNAGNGYAFKVRNLSGQVVGLRELYPDRVTVGVAPDGRKRFMVDKSETVYTTNEVWHVPGLAYDGRQGLNPIRTFGDALGVVAAADDYAAKWFGNSTHMGGVISVPQMMNKTEAEELRMEWDRFHQGLENAHRTGVLSKGATYSRVSLSAADAQLLESRQYGVTEIARMLRIPPHKLYDLTRATFSNIEHQAIEATTDSVRPWVLRIEAALNADRDLVLPGHYIEANLDGLLRGDSASVAASFTAAVQGGWMTPGLVARKQNLPSPPELDYYQRPLNVEKIDTKGGTE